MKKQKLIELLRKAYLSGIMENELAGRMVGVNHNLEDMATHYAEIEVNNGVLDDVNKRAFNVTYLANDEIIKGLTVLADSEEEAMHKALLLRDSKDIYSAIEVNVC